MVLHLDLNSPPIESWLTGGTSASTNPWFTWGTAVPVDPQVALTQSSSGVFGSPIDVEAIEDDVQMLSSSRGFPRGRNQSRRKRPVTVVLDADVEINSLRSGVTREEPVTTLSLGTYNNQERISTNRKSINCELYYNLEEDYDAKRKNVMGSSHTEPQKVAITPPPPSPRPPKEPTFTCPVCMNALEEACSTICGHIFCHGCIKASIQKQKKCPTCRRKLTKNNFHRVFLPSTSDY